jgi:hypothetical protein
MGGKTMRFLTLVKKEFRECLPSMCVAFVIFTGLAALLLHDAMHAQESRHGTENQYSPWCTSPIDVLGPLVLFTALGLGLAIGIRQFHVPASERTWAFTLHRPVNPSTIVHAKLTAAILGLVLFVGLPWTATYLYATVPGRFLEPIMHRVLGEGWLMIALGFVLYLGTAGSILNRGHWYAMKAFSLVFALTLVLVAVAEAPYPAPFVFIGIGSAVLGIQVYALMRSKEL